MGQLPPSQAGGHSVDGALVRQVAGGDVRALAELYDRYGPMAFALAGRITGDTGHAEDAVAQVFVSLWRDPGRFDPARGAFGSWVLAAVHHKAVEMVRRDEALRRRRAGLAQDAEEYVAGGQDPAVADPLGGLGLGGPGSDGGPVRTALQRLPDGQREALILAYYAGYTQREIATLTETPLGTVKTRMLDGMRRLRDLLDGVDTGEGVGR